MRFKKLDLNLLIALDSLLRTRSVSQAAAEMFITQPAMSNALARLRRHFDDPLLIAVGRKMTLSPLAESLRVPLRDIITRIEMAMETTPVFNPAASTRKISVILSDYTLHTLMPRVLARLARLAPGMTLELKAQHTSPHLLLEHGEADLLIAPDFIRSSKHPSELLWEDRLCCLVAADSTHPQRKFGRQAFEAAGQVVMQPPNGGESFAIRACRDAGLGICTEVTTFAFASMGELIRQTQRIAVIQRRLGRHLVMRDPGLRLVEMPIALPPLREMVQWHGARTHDAALNWLREQFHHAAAETA